jgi:hypothetical protein
MTENHRPPRTDVIDVAMAVDAIEVGTLPAIDEQGMPPDRPEGASRRIHSTGDQLASPLESSFRLRISRSALDIHGADHRGERVEWPAWFAWPRVVRSQHTRCTERVGTKCRRVIAWSRSSAGARELEARPPCCDRRGSLDYRLRWLAEGPLATRSWDRMWTFQLLVPRPP